MTRRRWIADEFTSTSAALTGGHADHLLRVLRAHVGQEFDIVAGETIRRGRITFTSDQRVEFELGEVLPAVSGTVTVTLLLSIFKFDRMEWAIEKCTELGVAKVMPVIAQRTESHLAAASQKRRERWQRIARQASEQSRRAAPPDILEPTKLKQALAIARGTRILLNESEEELSLSQALQSRSAEGEMVLAIGPEGGWTDTELDSFRQAGWVSASLGHTILRSETAAIAAVAVVMAELSRDQ